MSAAAPSVLNLNVDRRFGMTKKAAKKKVSKKVQAKGKVDVTHPDKSTSESEEVVEEKAFEQPTANVGVAFATTKNLGNYESLKVSVSINLPCYVDEIDEVQSFAAKWVNKKMEQVMDDLLSED